MPLDSILFRPPYFIVSRQFEVTRNAQYKNVCASNAYRQLKIIGTPKMINFKNTCLIFAMALINQASAQIAVDKEKEPPNRILSASHPYANEFKAQLGYIDPEQFTEARGGSDGQSPIALDDAMTRRAVRDVAGEKIDMRTGALSFDAVDVSVPGDGGMNIAVSRTRMNSFFASDSTLYSNERKLGDFMGDWSLNIPYIQLITIGVVQLDSNTAWAHTPFSFGGVCERPLPPNPFVVPAFHPNNICFN